MTSDELDPRTRAAETKKRRTRERAIRATVDLFSTEAVEQGLVAQLPTIEQIAEEGGIGAATLYTHFGTKYGLYRAALDQLFDQLIRPIIAAHEMGTYSPPDMLTEIISYVYKAAVMADHYRYLVTAYMQAYFETGEYRLSRISQPVFPGVNILLGYSGRKSDLLWPRFSSDYGSVPYHMDMLFVLTCAEGVGPGTPHKPQDVAYSVLNELLSSIDREYDKGKTPSIIGKEIERLVEAS